MNIAFIKLAGTVKVNKRDTVKALSSVLSKLLNTSEDIETEVINTSDIKSAGSGVKILLANNKARTKYVAISIGASTRDIYCVLDNGEDNNYSFEYVLYIDKKVFKGISVKQTIEECNNNNNELLTSAIAMIGKISSEARYQGILSGSKGATEEDNQYGGAIIVDYFDSKTEEQIDLEVIGRRGKLHLLQIVPILKDELEILDSMEDSTLNELIALRMIKDKKGLYNNRQKRYNFIDILDTEYLQLTEENKKRFIDSLPYVIGFDKNSLPVIDKKESVDKLFNILIDQREKENKEKEKKS